ncbi:MAG: MerR family transcriptional regulator [Oscillospiraceae bacterium]|jgi:DNA-binding transcriptional MerR regulator|nr:MerR family transcriptional regulator [Oscillospiraceae bacterium]
MEYTVNELSRLAGISKRTLHYYDEIGILKPRRAPGSDYRLYGGQEIDRLQQILFYRQFDFSLSQIRELLESGEEGFAAVLGEQLQVLLDKRSQLDRLIATAQQTMRTLKGEITMTDNEKFEGFKQKLIDENEASYGKEIRKKYGNATVDAANRRVQGSTQAEMQKMEALTQELNEALKTAVQAKEAPSSEAGQRVAALHKQWLCFYWPAYSAQAHINIVDMYLADERFKKYYEAIAPGAAVFLKEAVTFFCDS